MSTLPPECERLLISGYVLGNLSPAEAMLFQEMLAENPDLREEVAIMQRALDLAYAPPEIAPPEALRAKVLAAAKISPTVAPEVAELPKSKPQLSWNKILGAIALISIMGLGIINYRFWRTIEAAKVETLETEKRTYILESQDSSNKGVAKLVVDPAKLNAILTVNNLPPLPPGKVYALWTVVGKDAPFTTDEKGAILTAIFEVNTSSKIDREIILPQPHLTGKAIAKMAITIEDKAAPQEHQGSILIATEKISN